MSIYRHRKPIIELNYDQEMKTLMKLDTKRTKSNKRHKVTHLRESYDKVWHKTV